ncbi:hypothetical protein [Pseudoxanthomonas winnipegensis]|uniref:hypothetical protein n=1 Tax=Pseudoxanthomonas winnipegensis TaxID=2480810 RepID=UPI00102D88A0|nr:hypothetical protein [Pseudoxanthomonas winnipegensis]RZZ87795.1 hypothetical protein EA662_07815 [Pseudoxanthomonas winnipegensis]TBV78074.1 hypothetical protein EYC46_03635 [Pseudoxanthomonas winnipegensis]
MSKPASALFARHETAFASWIRRNGYAPAEAVEYFLNDSPYFKGETEHLDAQQRAELVEQTRVFLSKLSTENHFAKQFPTVYLCTDKQGRRLRYTITMTIGEDKAEWIGRVWAGSEYLGEVAGSGSGPKANYLALARMHVESQIDCADAIVKRPLPDFW